MTMTATDLYPSRNRSEPSVADRRDPVVYGDPADAPAPLGRAEVDAYARDGYLFLPAMFQPGEVARLRDELARLRADEAIRNGETTITEPGSGEVRSIFMIHKLSPTFRALASDPRLVAIAEFILGDAVYIHQSRLNYKPGFVGKEFYWHSDFETWHVEDGMPRMRALSMSISLTDNNELNGPLMLMPGSHLRYLACVGETPEDHYKQSLKAQEYGVPDHDALSRLADDGGIVAPTAKAGSVVVFDCNTMHGSNGNITPWPRSNAFLVYNAVSNRLVAPFGPKTPRPYFIAERDDIVPLSARAPHAAE
jgi:ectoine hydroxylase